MDDKLEGLFGKMEENIWRCWWLAACIFLTVLALCIMVELVFIWEEPHAFSLLFLGSFFHFLGIDKLEPLQDEVLVQATIAGLMGGIGSIIFCMKELFELEKKEDFDRELSHLLPRPFFGILLAIIFFFILKAGLITTAGTPSAASSIPDEDVVNAAKISAAAIGGLVGIFAEEAMFRLKAVAKALFMPEKASESR